MHPVAHQILESDAPPWPHRPGIGSAHARPAVSYTTPWSIIESATLRKPAMFAPLT
jgi:hypothetical protein